MKQNISIERLNRFAPEGFSFIEGRQGKIWVKNEKNQNMNHFECVGHTNLTIDDLNQAFRPFYNFTHREKDGKMIDDPIKILPLDAQEVEIDKSISDYMRSRSYNIKVAGAHLALKNEFDKLLEDKLPSLDSYLELVDKRLDNAEEYKNNAEAKKASKAPKKTFLGIGYKKKYSEWKRSYDAYDENKKAIEKKRYELQNKSMKRLSELEDNYYGNLFTQMILQSAVSAVEEDVRNHYNRLAEQHNASKVYSKLCQVQKKLESYGAGFGEVSGVVKADAMAEAKINKAEYKEPTRENKLQKARNNLNEKTFGGR